MNVRAESLAAWAGLACVAIGAAYLTGLAQGAQAIELEQQVDRALHVRTCAFHNGTAYVIRLADGMDRKQCFLPPAYAQELRHARSR